jgi:hypothetical protein
VTGAAAGDPGGGNIGFYLFNNPTTSSTYQLTFINAGTFPSGAIIAVDGLTTFDQTNAASSATVTTIQPGSITPGSSSELIVSALELRDGGASGFSVGSSFTIVETAQGSGDVGIVAAYLIQGAAAAINPVWSWTGSVRVAAAIASFTGTFSAGGGGGGGGTTQTFYFNNVF